MISLTTAAHPTVRRKADTAKVADLFYSLQGEGPSFGRRALFVRLMACNLTCGYAALPSTSDTPADGTMICDTEYTWNVARYDLSTARTLTSAEIWDELLRLDPATADPSLMPVDLVIVTGGEPLLHRDVVTHLAWSARADGRAVEVETNATVAPGSDLIAAGVCFNAGLKLESSAVPRARRIKPHVIRQLQDTGQARWKFVVTCPADIQEIVALQHEFGLTQVWLSPEGTTADLVVERMRWMADAALTHGWNMTSRAHVLIWGDERGR
ncbi:7-carboxy-7-deazaguanine synthase QueE [Micromonospora sp. Llam7]|uniref:7-carboxy-7-deazaguanine synthase QueE n=1 Tax=Micromonospora tarapacensis TaxID=2835305 RepID=UPI001C82ED2B|nr:7-carboxy-7-deazaguanine synthase QueE [Micromonospora tarapacensis]MBX7269600.1 7-carboxy-7-deazaguanine synthase QueE [Micromonospora tarapacensis]